MKFFSPGKPDFKTKEDSVYEILRESILDCDLKPGEKLVIDQISQQMDISTIPIRAAIQRLGMEGFVEIRPHSPARVAGISLGMIKETFVLLAALEQIAYEAITNLADTKKTLLFIDLLLNLPICHYLMNSPIVRLTNGAA